MKMVWTGAVVTACVTASLLVGGGTRAAAATGPKDPLGAVINDALREGGPFFTAPERALIISKCGYRPGEWDGDNININNGVFTCTNGKRVDDPQMRAMLKVASPRIGARVSAAMARPEVKEAIREVADEAVRNALAGLASRPAD
jgi:hypothetical protein